MAKFKILAPFVFSWEGGFSNHKYDLGGSTNKGITLKLYTAWRKKKGLPSPTIENLKDITDDEATQIYKEEFWDACLSDKIRSQDVANLLVDWRINSGVNAVRWLQRILEVKEDGVVGPITLKALNYCNDLWLFDRLKKERTEYYKRIAVARPTQKVFLTGWLRRVDSITVGKLVCNDGKEIVNRIGVWS